MPKILFFLFRKFSLTQANGTAGTCIIMHSLFKKKDIPTRKLFVHVGRGQRCKSGVAQRAGEDRERGETPDAA